MGEQNRRGVEIEPQPSGPKRAPQKGRPPLRDDPKRALSPEADERQTPRQAPAGASPGESAEGDSIG